MIPQNKLVLVLDSTQIEAYMECPRLWYYQYNQHLELNIAGEKEAMAMGSLGHLYLETYYKGIGRKIARDMAAREALAIDTSAHFCECGHAAKDHLSITDGTNPITKGSCLKRIDAGCECGLFTAAPVPLSAERINEVQEKCQMYFFTYQGRGDLIIPSESNVELGFSYPLFESFDRLYVLEGRIDLSDCLLGQTLVGFTDHKFQMRQRNLYKKSIQFRNYGMVKNAMFGMVNYVRFTKKNDASTFVREVISYAPGEHAWWRGELIKVYDRIAAQLADATYDKEYWWKEQSHPNWAMCSGKFGYECAYTPLCSGGDPSAERDRLYRIGKEWRPW